MKHNYKKCPRCGVKLAEESKLNDKYVTAGIIMIFLLVAALAVMLLSCYFMLRLKKENTILQEKQEKHSVVLEELQGRLDRTRNLYYREILHDINYIVMSHTNSSDLEYELKNLLQCNRLLVAFDEKSKLPRMIEKYVLLTALLNADKNLRSVKLSEKDYWVLSPEFVEKCTKCRNGMEICADCKGVATCEKCQIIKKCSNCSASGFIVHIRQAEKALKKTRSRIHRFVEVETGR
ncbi:MAG: hypothetical protein J6C40_01420 [Lentisphaeria bacterium]|nr:hypothetical protein [Lentisphaeria bacterium]